MDVNQDRLRITVLHVLARPDGTTRYVNHMVEGAPNSLNVLTYSWKRALLGHYDVLHIHWPENLIRGSNLLSSLGKRILFVLLMMRLKLNKTPVVRTLHNVHPHEGGGSIEEFLLGVIDSRTDAFIRLNTITDAPADKQISTILHGHYMDRVEYQTDTAPDPRRLLYFGLIRPYKGVENLLATFLEYTSSGADASLRIVGNPKDTGIQGEILRACTENENVTSRLEFAPDRELAEEIASSSLVVLPYREMHNSGSMILSLSMGRPVLVPATDVNTSLQQEFGAEWVYLFEGNLSADDLRRAIEGVANDERATRPQMDERAWDVVGTRHYDLYKSVLVTARERPRESVQPG